MNTMWSHSELPIKAISENRNGKQGDYLEVMRRELDFAMDVEMPQADGKHRLARPTLQFCPSSLTNLRQTGPRSTFKRLFKCS